MNDDDNLPRAKDDPLSMLIKQDLDPFSVEELQTRISLLKSEINRCETKKNQSVTHRASAENMFKKP